MKILYQCNNKYAPYCGISVTSLFENNKSADSIEVFILGDDISIDNRNRFNALAILYNRNITFIDTTPITAKLNQLGVPKYRGSQTANFKLFAEEYMLTDEPVLYIDSDTIVSGDISELFNNCQKYPAISMCYDSLVTEHKQFIGISSDAPYYNSGVILFNMQILKERKYIQRLLDHIKNVRAHYPSPDQDLLNVVFNGEIGLLPAKYNFQPILKEYKSTEFLKIFKHKKYYSAAEIEEAASNPAICHFFRYLGEFPWHKNNLHPFNSLFDKYMLISPWNDYRKEESDISFVFKAEKLLYRLLPKAAFIRVFHFAHTDFMRKSDKLSLENKNNQLM